MVSKQCKSVIIALTVVLVLCVLLASKDARAIPAFARKYETSCQTCHIAFPKLNAFGEAFRANGYKFPVDDEDVIKQPPVELGAPAWKKVWPDAVWPSTIPHSVPFSLLVDSSYHIMPDNTVTNDFAIPSDLQLLSGGTLGESFSFYGALTLLEQNEFGGLHRLFGQFNRIGGSPALNVRFGGFEPRYVPFSSHRKLMLTNYAMNDLAVGTSLRSLDDLTSPGGHGGGHGAGPFSLGSSQRGLELWGVVDGPNGGGLEWAFGVTNGNGLGGFSGALEEHVDEAEEHQEEAEHLDSGRLAVEDEHGDEHVEQGGHAFATLDNTSSKDIYGRLSYKIGGMSRTGREMGTPSDSNNWVDDSVRFGAFFIRGENRLGLTDEIEDHRRYGVDLDLWFKDLNLYGAYMWGKNKVEEHDGIRSFDMNSWFVEANYVMLPWMIPALRYEVVSVQQLERSGIELAPRLEIMRRIVPHITLLLRSNVKFSFETNQFFNDFANEHYRFNVDFAF